MKQLLSLGVACITLATLLGYGLAKESIYFSPTTGTPELVCEGDTMEHCIRIP